MGAINRLFSRSDLKGYGQIDTYKQREYFCSCLRALGALTLSPRFLFGPQIERKLNPPMLQTVQI